MKRFTLSIVCAGLLVLSATAASAGVGNGGSDVPPGLVQAMERTTANMEKQIQKEEQSHVRKIAKLEELLDELMAQNLLVGGLEEDIADAEAAIQKQTERHEQRMAKLQIKLQAKQQKFLDKMERFRQKYGSSSEDEEVPPPPEDENLIVD